MKHVKWKNICLIIFAFAFSSTLFATESLEESALIAQQSKKSKKQNKSSNGSRMQRNANRDPNVWKPFFQCTKVTEPITSFYQQTVGIGFLYFSDIKGNLNDATVGVLALDRQNPLKSNTKLKGHLGYNRTPVVEFVIGRDIWYWLKIALSYTHQGGIVVQTMPQSMSADRQNRNNANFNNILFAPDLTTHVRLDAALFRVYFMSPWTLVWKNYYHEPYFSAGVGPGWQTWADIKPSVNFTNALRMKVSANCVFVIDFGMKMRRAMPTYVMSFTMGCKYFEWGQARQMGARKDQYRSAAPIGQPLPAALSNPLRIKTVYSFVPYIGVQFNY